MGDTLEKTNYSIEEYLTIEQETGEKYEYYFGEVFAMPDEEPIHRLLTINVAGSLREVMKGKTN